MSTPDLSRPEPALEPQQIWFSTPDAAAYLGVSAQWLRQLRTRGTGPRYHRKGHQLVRYHRDDLDAWMTAG